MIGPIHSAAVARPRPRATPRQAPPLKPAPRPQRDPEDRTHGKGLERLGDLLPEAARDLGLEDELELAGAISAWQRIVAERVPAAVGSCRLVRLGAGRGIGGGGPADSRPGAPARAPELTAALRLGRPRSRAPASSNGEARIIATAVPHNRCR